VKAARLRVSTTTDLISHDSSRTPLRSSTDIDLVRACNDRVPREIGSRSSNDARRRSQTAQIFRYSGAHLQTHLRAMRACRKHPARYRLRADAAAPRRW